MRITVFKFLLPCLSLLNLALLPGCEPCEPLQYEYFLTSAERERLDHGPDEVIVMENGAGDQRRLKVVGPERSIERTNSLRDCLDCNACSTPEHYSETVRVGLVEVDGGAFEAGFEIQATLAFDAQTITNVPATIMECRLPDVEFSWSQVADSAGLDRYYPSSIRHDILVVRGHTYHHVWEVLGRWADYGGVYGHKIWFAEDGGLVRLEYTDGVVWERLP